ncbi:unnamed protein product [Closterium sp. Yama58-4]|nr:unnamed protein product [Closterium sp. Yama58-4]
MASQAPSAPQVVSEPHLPPPPAAQPPTATAAAPTSPDSIPRPPPKPYESAAAAPGSSSTASVSEPFVPKQPVREDMVRQAVSFLSNPKVRSSPVRFRRAFLERKGMSAEEIDEAFRRCPDPSTGSEDVEQQAQAQQAFSWSKLAVALAVVGAGTAGTAAVAKRLVLPRLKTWLQETAAQEASKKGKRRSKQAAKKSSKGKKGSKRRAQEAMTAEVQQLKAANVANAAAGSGVSGGASGAGVVGAAAAGIAAAGSDMRSALASRQPTTQQQQRSDPPYAQPYSAQSYSAQSYSPQPYSAQPWRPSSAPAPSSASAALGAGSSSALTGGPSAGSAGAGSGGAGAANGPPHPKSFYEVMEMVKRGETPPGIKDINDKPPNPEQPPSDSRLARPLKPYQQQQQPFGHPSAYNHGVMGSAYGSTNGGDYNGGMGYTGASAGARNGGSVDDAPWSRRPPATSSSAAAADSAAAAAASGMFSDSPSGEASGGAAAETAGETTGGISGGVSGGSSGVPSAAGPSGGGGWRPPALLKPVLPEAATAIRQWPAARAPNYWGGPSASSLADPSDVAGSAHATNSLAHITRFARASHVNASIVSPAMSFAHAFPRYRLHNIFRHFRISVNLNVLPFPAAFAPSPTASPAPPSPLPRSCSFLRAASLSRARSAASAPPPSAPHRSPSATHPSHAQHAPLPLPFRAACSPHYASRRVTTRAAAAGVAGDRGERGANGEQHRGISAETGRGGEPIAGLAMPVDFEECEREQAECVVVGAGVVGLAVARGGGAERGSIMPVDFDSSEREQVECVVVGAGVVGLAVARALAAAGREVVVVEVGEGVGGGISSRNSEVIHAGLYYPHGSLKARFCVEGRRQLYAFCEDRGVPHRRVGKLVVATSADQVLQLEKLKASTTALQFCHTRMLLPCCNIHPLLPTHAQGNGVEGLQMLSQEEAREMEPRVQCHAALLSPHTGIVDTHALMLALQAEAEAAEKNRFDPDPTDRTRFTGAHDATSQLPPLHLPALYLARGHYFACSGPPPFSRLVYPLPEPGGLGVHATVDLAGRVRFGPDVQWLDSVPLSAAHGMPISYDYSVDPQRAESFYSAIRKYYPTLADGSLHAGYAGIRPKLTAPGEPAADFVIQTHATHGMPGLIHLLGIESPGLTSCLAIGDHVKHLL